MTWTIALISLLTFPIIGFLIFYLTRERLEVRKEILMTFFVINLLAVFGLVTNISTTMTALDWIILSTFYLTISTLLWVLFGLKNKIIKVASAIIMFCVFGLGYVSATVGALGVGFITGDYTPQIEKNLGNGIIYKETSLGNALSDYRRKRVEIFKTIPWLPIIEWRIVNKTYESNIVIMTTPLIVNYKPDERKIYLSASMRWGYEQTQEKWSDTIVLK